jgi:hypothetical protein
MIRPQERAAGPHRCAELVEIGQVRRPVFLALSTLRGLSTQVAMKNIRDTSDLAFFEP